MNHHWKNPLNNNNNNNNMQKLWNMEPSIDGSGHTYCSSESSSSSSSDETDDTDEESSFAVVKKHVSFGWIMTRVYDITLGDHPACSDGPPITLAWRYYTEPLRRVNHHDDDVNKTLPTCHHSHNHHKNCQEDTMTRVSAPERCQWLQKRGFTWSTNATTNSNSSNNNNSSSNSSSSSSNSCSSNNATSSSKTSSSSKSTSNSSSNSKTSSKSNNSSNSSSKSNSKSTSSKSTSSKSSKSKSNNSDSSSRRYQQKQPYDAWRGDYLYMIQATRPRTTRRVVA